MYIVVDGIIFRKQTSGGISRIFAEILPRMCQLQSQLHVELIISGHEKQNLPTHPQIRCQTVPLVERILRPSRMWNPLVPHAQALITRALTGSTHRRVWHSTYYTSTPFWSGPRVVTVYDMIHERYPNLFNKSSYDTFRRQKKKCILSAEVIICISETTKQDLMDYYNLNSSRVHVIPLAGTEVFRKLPEQAVIQQDGLERPFLLYVGGRDHYKGFITLLEAYSRWPARRGVDLVLVGRPWNEDEVRQLRHLGLEGQVHIRSRVRDIALCQLYNQAVAFVYPSLYEGFGIPLLEAMACGCPIVASRIPSTVEVADDIPIYFQPGKADDLVASLNNVLQEGCYSARIQSGLQHIQQYSWDKTAKETLKVYQSLI